MVKEEFKNDSELKNMCHLYQDKYKLYYTRIIVVGEKDQKIIDLKVNNSITVLTVKIGYEIGKIETSQELVMQTKEEIDETILKISRDINLMIIQVIEKDNNIDIKKKLIEVISEVEKKKSNLEIENKSEDDFEYNENNLTIDDV
ncbi:hypothetical protein RCL_jg24309.t1 [Rhizophagus clarus]|uniref:Uncharacterized protein n=1 Tax=Rhizophagus clarus TaxID=94130 RepID=A0A8H3MJK8_9GLOM|nr:hypothetical protein RCL_jg24309.t1 [Rhizophagus clarus]